MSTQGSDSEVAKSQPEEELKRDEAGENVAADKEGAAGPPAWINDAPDGGRDAWLMVLGAWCCSFVSFGWLNSTFCSSSGLKYVLTSNRRWHLPGILHDRSSEKLLG
jgi:hypothetical protein